MSVLHTTNRFAFVLVTALTLPACPADDPRPQDETGSGSSESTGTDTGTTRGGTETSVGDSSSSDTSSSTSESSSTGEDLNENGEECLANADCRSGHCFQVGFLGSFCGECNSETDCPNGGCTPPNPLADPPTPSVCNEGGLGEACNTAESCVEGLQCIEIASIPQLIEISSCSECASDVDCNAEKGLLCGVVFDIPSLTGSKSCVASGTVASGQGCDIEGSGDAQCSSGICSAVDVLNGAFTLGVCGDCRTNDDCLVPGEECLPVNVDNDFNVIPARCGKP